MKKYRNYIILLIVLLIVAVVLYVKDKPGTLKTDRKIFAVTDTAHITKIRIGDGVNELTLERSGFNWQINKNYYARPRAVRALLHLLSNLEINSPVPKSAKKEVFNSFSHQSVFVTI